jgi:collagenase-like PrtC family protease
MKYTVGFNWDNNLFSKINYPEIYSVYAGEGSSVIGSGRAPLVIKSVNEEQIRKSICLAHRQGLEFDFTLNSGCLSNKEFTKEGHKEIVNYLEWIADLGIDSITVTLPSIINIAKKYIPNVKIKVSTFQKIGSVEMAKRFANMGVDTIMLGENYNRDFKLIESIRKATTCKLTLIANVGCIYHCPNSHSHIGSTSHSCDCDKEQSIFTIIPHSADCMLAKLKNPENIVKARYIRPEDVPYYEELGVDMLKICDRHTKTDIMQERVEAYIKCSYEGNLLDLIGQKSERKSDEINQEEFRKILARSNESRDKAIEYFKYFDFSISDLIQIDNNKYPSDYLEWFKNHDCTRTDCKDCGYCKRISDKVLTVDSNKVGAVLIGLNNLRERMHDGSILC